jgi:hypothetical protein
VTVLDSPPMGRCEASDSHGVIVTCFWDDREVESWCGRQLCPRTASRRPCGTVSCAAGDPLAECRSHSASWTAGGALHYAEDSLPVGGLSAAGEEVLNGLVPRSRIGRASSGSPSEGQQQRSRQHRAATPPAGAALPMHARRFPGRRRPPSILTRVAVSGPRTRGALAVGPLGSRTC